MRRGIVAPLAICLFAFVALAAGDVAPGETGSAEDFIVRESAADVTEQGTLPTPSDREILATEALELQAQKASKHKASKHKASKAAKKKMAKGKSTLHAKKKAAADKIRTRVKSNTAKLERQYEAQHGHLNLPLNVTTPVNLLAHRECPKGKKKVAKKVSTLNACGRWFALDRLNHKLVRLSKGVKFKPNRSRLTSAGKRTLDKVAKLLRGRKEDIKVTGVTSLAGEKGKQLVLGRGEAAAAYLKQHDVQGKITLAGDTKSSEIGLKLRLKNLSKQPKGCTKATMHDHKTVVMCKPEKPAPVHAKATVQKKQKNREETCDETCEGGVWRLQTRLREAVLPDQGKHQGRLLHILREEEGQRRAAEEA
jgi:outer membrane protein OmpA-like peptidoglycan-associated protein